MLAFSVRLCYFMIEYSIELHTHDHSSRRVDKDLRRDRWRQGPSRTLRHRSYASFHKAVRENTLGFPVFDLPGRKGKFARTADVVAWLTALTGPKQPSKAVKRRVTATPVDGASLNGRKARIEEVNRGAKDRARPAVKKPD